MVATVAIAQYTRMYVISTRIDIAWGTVLSLAAPPTHERVGLGPDTWTPVGRAGRRVNGHVIQGGLIQG